MALLGLGTIENPYLISTVNDLLLIKDYDGAGQYFELTNDIQLPYRDSRFPITTIISSCTIDGKGYKLHGGEIYSSANPPTTNWGIFSRISSVTVRNLGLENITVVAGARTGLFAGSSSGSCSFENCYIKGGQVRSYANPNSGSSAWNYYGGFVGYPSSAIVFTNCFINTLNLLGFSYVGGFVGLTNGHTFTNCYSIISGGVYSGSVGSFAPSATNGHIISSSYYSNSGTNSNGANLRTTEQLKNPTNLPTFDFENIWGYNSEFNDGYPLQKVFLPIESLPVIDSRRVVSYMNLIDSTSIGDIVHPLIKLVQVDSYIDAFNSKIYLDLIMIIRKQIKVVSDVQRIDSSTNQKIKVIKELLSYMNKITNQVKDTNNLSKAQLNTMVKLLENQNDIRIVQYLMNDIYMISNFDNGVHLENKSITQYQKTKTEVRLMALAGDTVQLQVKFKTFDGTVIEPTNVKLKIYLPTSLGTFDLINTIPLSNDEKVSVGEYKYDYTTPSDLDTSQVSYLVYEFSGLVQDSITLARGKINIRFV